MLRPDQEYSEYTDRYINWNGLIEELKACINAVGGAAVVNRTQYEDSWRGVQLGLSQLRAQLQQFADSVNTNIGAAQSLASQKGIANGIASLDGNVKLTASQLPILPTPTAAQTGAIALGEKGTAGGVATLGADGILTLSQRPESSGTANAIPTSEKGAPNGVATLGADSIVPTAQLPPFETPGTASGLLALHTSAVDPHSQYATDTDLANHAGNTSNPHATTAAQVGAIATSQRGAANGVASLGADLIVPTIQLPPFEAPGTASALLTAHTSAPDPHAQYATDTDLSNHTSNTNNPHSVTAAQTGAIATSQRGVANGVATLGADGLLTAAQVRNTSSGWIAATLLNGWTNFGSGFANAEYRLWSDGWVELRGLIKNTVAPAATSDILILPVGYRPTAGIIYATNAAHGFGAIYTLSSGELKYQSGSITFLSIAIPPFKAI